MLSGILSERGKNMLKIKSRKIKAGIMLFIVPALLIYVVFQIIPIIGAVFFS